MPKLNSQTLNTASGFSFSGEAIHDLTGNDHYTLVCIAIDCSSSTLGFVNQMKDSVLQIINACRGSKLINSVLVRMTTFRNHNVDEILGYTLPNKIDDSVVNLISAGGSTPLNDACVESVESASTYGKKLAESFYITNAIVFVITDGEENTSKIVASPSVVNKKVCDVKREESLESIKTVLVGLCGCSDINSYLQNYKDQAGFDDYVNASLGDVQAFKKLGNFVSQSISSTSNALGTGAPSKSLTF